MRKFKIRKIALTIVLSIVCASLTNVLAQSDVYEINNASDLADYRSLINGGTKQDAILMADIDLSGVENWVAIGNSVSTAYSNQFNGNNHTIAGMNFTIKDAENVAIFGYTTATSVIKNLIVEGSIEAKSAGGIVGTSEGLIQDCIANVSISTTEYAGGIVSKNNGSIVSCKSFGEIISSNYAGGIVGLSTGTISGSQNYAMISGASYIGGIVGKCTNNIECSNNYGSIASNNTYAGGIVGMLNGGSASALISVSNCVNRATVDVVKNSGGIVGGAEGYMNISNCTNEGSVNGTGQWIGGIVGATAPSWSYSGIYNIDQCVNLSNVYGGGNFAGGIVGCMLVGDISNSYNTAKILSLNTYGGIVGFAYKSKTTIKNTFNYSSNTLNFSNAVCTNVCYLGQSSTEQCKTAKEFKDGTVLGIINGDDVWEQGSLYPIHHTADKTGGIATFEELQAALEDNSITDIVLKSNIEITDTLKIDRPININGNGYILSGDVTLFYITAENVTLNNTIMYGSNVLVSAENSDISLGGVSCFYNTLDYAFELNNSNISLTACEYFYTMPGSAIRSNQQLQFNINYEESINDSLYIYKFNTVKTNFSKVTGIALLKADNEGLSYDVYGFKKNALIYLMVPSCVNMSNCVYTEIDRDGLPINKVNADFSGSNTYSVKIGNLEYTINPMQSGLPTMYIDINEEYGTIKAMNSSVDHSVPTYGNILIDVPQALITKYGWKASYKSVDGSATTPESAEIKGRGNSTWNTDDHKKKPYAIKTEKKVDFLGMGKAKSWCLIKDSNHFVGQKLGLDLGLAMGLSSTPDSRFVEVFMNGEYLGCYALTEKVQIKEERVEITDLEGIVDDTGITPETDLTGGYLLEVDNYSNDPIRLRTNGNVITVKSPENLDVSATKDNNYAYIYNYIDELFTAIYTDGKMKDGSSYLAHINIESFVRYYWHQEFIANMDCGIGSTYLYKDSDSVDPLLYAGPVWDSDNMLKTDDVVTTWYVKNRTRYGGIKTLYNQLMCRKDFVSYVIWYYENTDIPDVLASSVDFVHEYESLITTADDMDYARWSLNSFNNSERLISMLERRKAWIDENYKSLIDEATIGEPIDVDEISKRPTGDKVIIEGTINGVGTTIKNTTYGILNPYAILAGYNGDRFIKSNIINVGTIVPGESKSISFNMNVLGCDNLKLMVFDGIDSLNPICNRVDIKGDN